MITGCDYWKHFAPILSVQNHQLGGLLAQARASSSKCMKYISLWFSWVMCFPPGPESPRLPLLGTKWNKFSSNEPPGRDIAASRLATANQIQALGSSWNQCYYYALVFRRVLSNITFYPAAFSNSTDYRKWIPLSSRKTQNHSGLQKMTHAEFNYQKKTVV